MKKSKRILSYILGISIIASGLSVCSVSASENTPEMHNNAAIKQQSFDLYCDSIEQFAETQFGEKAVIRKSPFVSPHLDYYYILDENGIIYYVEMSNDINSESKHVRASAVNIYYTPRIILYSQQQMNSNSFLLTDLISEEELSRMDEESIKELVMNYIETQTWQDYTLIEGPVYDAFLNEYFDSLYLADERAQVYHISYSYDENDDITGISHSFCPVDECCHFGFDICLNEYSDDTEYNYAVLKDLFESSYSFTVQSVSEPCSFLRVDELKEEHKKETDYLRERTAQLINGTLSAEKAKAERKEAKYNYLHDIGQIAEEPENDNYTSSFRISGDLNSDGSVDVTDLTELAVSLIGDKELTASQQKAADIDNDGDVKLADLAKLRQFLSKQISSLA